MIMVILFKDCTLCLWERMLVLLTDAESGDNKLRHIYS